MGGGGEGVLSDSSPPLDGDAEWIKNGIRRKKGIGVAIGVWRIGSALCLFLRDGHADYTCWHRVMCVAWLVGYLRVTSVEDL